MEAWNQSRRPIVETESYRGCSITVRLDRFHHGVAEFKYVITTGVGDCVKPSIVYASTTKAFDAARLRVDMALKTQPFSEYTSDRRA